MGKTAGRGVRWIAMCRLCVCFAVAVIGFTAARDARADASGEAYSDAKAIIEQLITQEFAESATVWLTCASFKREQGDGAEWRTNQLPRYYLHSLQKLEERQWGSLPATLRDDTIDAMADYVLYAAKAEHEKAKIIAPPKSKKGGVTTVLATTLRSFLDRPTEWKVEITAMSDGKPEKRQVDLSTVCKEAMNIGSADRQYYREALIRHIHHAAGVAPAVDTCLVDDEDTSAAMACALGRSVKAAMQGRATEAQANLLHFTLLAAGEKGAQPLTAELRERFLTALLLSLKGGAVDGKRPDDLLAPIMGFLRSVPRDAKCGTSGSADVVTYVTGKAPEGVGLGCVAAWADFSKLNMVVTPAGGAPVTTTLTDVVSAVPRELHDDPTGQDAVAKALLCATRHPACAKDAIDLTKATGTITINEGQNVLLSWNVGTSKVKDVTALAVTGPVSLVQLAALVRTIQDTAVKLNTALQEVFPNQTSDTRALFGHAMQLVRLAGQLRRLKLFSGEQLEFSGLLDATLSVIGETTTCAAPSTPVQPGTPPSTPATPPASATTCVAVSTLADVLKSRGTEMSALINAAAKHDHRTLAVTLLETMLPEDDPSTSVTCNVDRPPYRRLTVSFVTYVLDDTRGDGQTVSRDAFRAAAVDLVRCVSDSGLHRSPKGSAGRAILHTFFRSASFRASWNPAYDQGDGSSFRVVPSLVGFTIHVPFTSRQSSWYAGLEMGAIDWLAPLSEVAIRRGDAGYSHNELLVLEAVRPRLDLFLGLPMLTEHLALSAGISFRMAAPERGRPGETEAALTPKQFTYVPFWENRNAAAWLELGAGVHYVF